MPGMPPPPPPEPSGGGGVLKALGGCGLAGCLGAGVAGLLGVGLIVALVAIAGADSGSSSGSGTPSSGTPTTGSDELPNHGSLRNLVKSNVGVYRLKETAPVTRLGDRLQGGVVDKLGAIYRAPDGNELVQILLAYSSRDAAMQKMNIVYDVLRADFGYAAVTRENVLNRKGQIIGIKVVANEAKQHVYWSNSNVLTFVTANASHPVRFYDACEW